VIDVIEATCPAASWLTVDVPLTSLTCVMRLLVAAIVLL